jgi:hypothetical protein
MDLVALIAGAAGLVLVVWLGLLSIWGFPLLRRGYRPWAPGHGPITKPGRDGPATVVTCRVLRGWPVTPFPRVPLAVSRSGIVGPGAQPDVCILREEVRSIAVIRWRLQGTFLLFRSDDHRHRNVAIGPLDVDPVLGLLDRLGWPIDAGDRTHP